MSKHRNTHFGTPFTSQRQCDNPGFRKPVPPPTATRAKPARLGEKRDCVNSPDA